MIETKASPRIEDDVLYWYEGNTFDIQMKFTLPNSAEPLAFRPGDRIVINFRRKKAGQPIVTSFEFTELTEDGEIILTMDQETTMMFPTGSYLMGVTYYGEYITTLIDRMEVIVEPVV